VKRIGWAGRAVGGRLPPSGLIEVGPAASIVVSSSMTASVFLLNSSAPQALATISASASQILTVVAPPSVFTLGQRVAHCVRQNACMATCNNGRYALRVRHESRLDELLSASL